MLQTTAINPIDWTKKNLFNTWYNSILTVLSLLFIYWIGSGLVNWIFNIADWIVLKENLRLFFVGTYPIQLLWRVWLSLIIVTFLGGLSWGILSINKTLFNRQTLMILGIISFTGIIIMMPLGLQAGLYLLGLILLIVTVAFLTKNYLTQLYSFNKWLPLIWLITFFIVTSLVKGGLLLKEVRIEQFSGLLLTLFAAIISIVLCFPFGVLLALGRQSKLPVIRWLSIGYIEIIRALPLLGILFMAQIMLPLILPSDVRLDRVIRAICGFVLFASAYLAENIRGGLQSIPKGQTEAAKALGLNMPLVLMLIVLPQAIKAVIPAIVGQFISLFKDTSLLSIVGLIDLLGISQSILSNPKYIGRYQEVYLFIALIYWICCYAMALASKNIEKKPS